MTRWLGIDVGWVFPAADSDGNVYEWTWHRRPKEPLAIAGPVKITRPNGVVITQPPFSLQEKAIADARADQVRANALANRVVTVAARSGRGVALEDWSSFQRRKAAWVRVYRAVASTAAKREVPVTQVNRAYTSITCPKCDLKTRANRPTRDHFVCVGCGFSGHADVVAAMNIARRAEGTFGTRPGECENPICDKTAWKAGACVACYRFKRRTGRVPTLEDIEIREGASELRAYRMAARRYAESPTEQGIRARMVESYRSHDAWGNPLSTGGDKSGAKL